MNISEYPMFQIPIIVFEIEDWTSKKKSLLDLYLQQEMEDSTKYGWKKVSTSYHSIFNSPHKHKKLCKSLEFIFRKEFGWIREETGIHDLKLQSAWYQNYSKTHEHSVHNHGATGFSFVCYIEYDNNFHEATTFVSPFNNFVNGDALFHSPKVSEGSFIIFPSFVHHYAPANHSDSERLILSGNLKSGI